MSAQDDGPDWLEGYATLALRVDRAVRETSGGMALDYRGPDRWRREVEAEPPPDPARLVAQAEELLPRLPPDPQRAAYLTGQVRAAQAVARRLAGETLPLAAFAHACLDVPAAWLDEAGFEAAHAELDAALPGPGPVAQRFHRWQDAHALPDAHADRLPELVARAVAETRRRTAEFVPLPADEEVGCALVHDVPFLAAGHHAGGLRSTIFVNADLPFTLADLLYVVAHEGHPGHIAEQLLKEQLLVGERGRGEQEVRFMLSPHFVVSEGLGLHAQEILFPGDEAQAWLTDHVLGEFGIARDGSDFAAVHRARNALFGAWCNAALLRAAGRPTGEVAAYLERWALLRPSEVEPALRSIAPPFGEVYVFSYHHGWDLLRTWLAGPDRGARVRRLLTEQLRPADLAPAAH
jgi:hypothetical protein